MISEHPYNEDLIHRNYTQWEPCYKQMSAIKEGVIMRLQCIPPFMFFLLAADNIMIRDGSKRMVIIDFGLACQRDRVPAGEPPVGGQVHMSPEKAASEGYGHGADVWAATVVLVHMLAGIEPWMVRFGGKQFLHLIVNNCFYFHWFL